MRLHRWLREPHVVATYGLGHRPTLEKVVAKYGPRTRDGRTRACVVEVDGAPAGYVQAYRIPDYPDYAAVVGVTGEVHGIDLFLGEPDLVGRGIGPRVIRRFVEDEVFAKTTAVAVVADPRSDNPRSVRAFEKAGFRRWKTVVPSSPEQGDLLVRVDRPVAG